MRDNLAIQAHKQSIANAMAGNKQAWLDLFTEDAEVFDPVGPSPHDPEGQGFCGKARLAQFWDMMIQPGLTVVPHKRIPCGELTAAVLMTATNVDQGIKTSIEMIGVYETNADGKLIRLKVYWDSGNLLEQLAQQGVML